MIRLKHVATEVRQVGSYDRGLDLPYIGLEHIESYTGRLISHRSLGPTGSVSHFRAGHILFGKLRPYLAKVALPEFDGTCSTEAIVLKTRPGYEPRFLRYVLLSKPFLDEVSISTYGAKMPRTSWEFIRNRLVPNPTPEEQKRIADFLDQETARIDELISKKARLLEIVDERWKATLDEAILGFDSGGRRVHVSHPYIRTIPEGWYLIPLKHLTDPHRPIMYGIVLPGPNVDVGVMIVKGGDVKPGRLSPDLLAKTSFEIEARYSHSRLRAGDLVVSIRGAVGDVEIVPPEIEGANLTQDVARVAPREGVLNIWLRYALKAPSVNADVQARTRGAAVRGISIFDLKQVRVPTPSLGRQHAIAQRLGEKEARLRLMEDKIRAHQTKLREFRSALITAAVIGQLDVDAWMRRGETERILDKLAVKHGRP